jgi:hypothetical protein
VGEALFAVELLKQFLSSMEYKRVYLNVCQKGAKEKVRDGAVSVPNLKPAPFRPLITNPYTR